ncbi:MAG: orotidine-5'-phosphate decarboxylase [Sphingomonadales bacterium]|nr:orotidine-5'-phosphate decarboxylase [Sphingomonadales bacterium]
MAPIDRAEIPPDERLIVALDVATVEAARELIGRLGDSVRFYKIGKQLIYAGGLDLVRELKAAGKRVFLDAKLYDIPNTVESAVQSILALGADFLTVHAERSVVRAAVTGRADADLRILAVTVLTSMAPEDLEEMGIGLSLAYVTARRAETAVVLGADGLICSAQEAKDIRSIVGKDCLLVCPGIRPAGASTDDQARIATPAAAIQAGADYLVVGRPITQAEDPEAAAVEIQAEIQSAG